jgi:hypothetical protein
VLREGLRIEALVQAGKEAEARAAATAFAQRFPKSVMQPVVDDALQRFPKK